MMYRSILLMSVLLLGACGGGGSGSSSTNTLVGGTTGGTTTGGGTTGGGVVVPSGGGFDFDTGIGGSGGAIGDIDGFGSIIMNGLELETESAEFYIEGQSGFSQSDLREGQYIVVAGDISGSIAEEVVYRSNLKGPVSAAPDPIDAAAGVYEFTVLDQTVLTSASTRFDGVLAANIVQGNLLEVSGPIDQQGQVLATYIALKSTLTEYKAIGRVAMLNTTDETFDLGGLLVDYSSASLDEFEGAALAEGQLVEVKMSSASYPAAVAVPVTEVELLPEAQLGEGAEMEVEGVIDEFTSATDFTVGGLPVTTDASTQYEDGGAAQLGLNVRVEVEGTVNADGVIVAESIEFEDEPAIRVEGRVTAVNVSAGTVTVMGLTFEVNSGTELEDDSSAGADPLTLDDLVADNYVEIRGYLDGTTIIAVELERNDEPNPGEYRARLRGPLTAIDEPNNRVEIQGVTVTEQDGTTQYEDASGTSSRSEFYGQLELGLEVEAEWRDFSSFSLPADSLSLED